MSMLATLGQKYRVQKKLIEEGKAGNPEYILEQIEAVLKQARQFQNLDRPHAIMLAQKAKTDCDNFLLHYRQEDNVDIVFELNAIKAEIDAFLTNFSAEEIDRALHKSDGDSYLFKAREAFMLAKKIKNIHRLNSITSVLDAITCYDDSLVFFNQENVGRKNIAMAEKKEAEGFLKFFSEEEIAQARKKVLRGKNT